MRKILFLVIVSLLSVGLISGAVMAGQTINVYVDGKEVVSDVPAQILDGRAMVPTRFIAEALGAKVRWDAENNSVIIESKKNITTSMANGVTYSLLKVNGEQTTWPYWYEDGILHMEYRNTMELLRYSHNHPSFSVQFYKGSDKMAVSNGTFDVETKIIDGYTTISLNYLRDRKGLLNFSWDPEAGDLKLIPVE